VELVGVATIPDGGVLNTQFRYRLPNAPPDPNVPAVVESFPARGALDVDPATTELRVTFDRPMQDHAWAWVDVGGNYPKGVGAPRYVDARTCVLPVHLKPHTEYVVWINYPRFEGFRSAEGTPSRPYELRFTTK
jgi:hypothetical protein